MKALVTGFDAFGGDKVNPSSLAVRRLKRKIGGLTIHTVELPTSYARSPIVLRAAIHEVQPDIVLGVGQAGGRSELCLERVAINVQDARIKDNDGKQPIDRPVVRDGPAAYLSTLPIKACVAEMRKAGLPASVSNSAGTFVCNHVFYAVMDMSEAHSMAFRGGFLHIPYIPEQASRVGGAPSMSLDDIVRGIEIVLAVSAARQTDLHSVEGRISWSTRIRPSQISRPCCTWVASVCRATFPQTGHRTREQDQEGRRTMTIGSDLLKQHFETLVADNGQWQSLINDDLVWDLVYAPSLGHPARLSGRERSHALT